MGSMPNRLPSGARPGPSGMVEQLLAKRIELTAFDHAYLSGLSPFGKVWRFAMGLDGRQQLIQSFGVDI
jgi:hypothetical protein